MSHRTVAADPASYTPLLAVIASVESKNNDNAYYGNSHNQTIRFTDMSIREVLAWQAAFVAEGNLSSAVGRYQIINTTLRDLATIHNISLDQKFDRTTQDQLATYLLVRRGSDAYINQRLSPQAFAHNLSKEWAALPQVIGSSPEASYYAGDGLNQSLVDSSTVLQAISHIRPQAKLF